MAASIIGLRIIACILMAYRFYLFIKIKMEDKSTKFNFELMSLIEHAAGYGVFLVAILCVLDENVYMFTLVLNIINVFLVATHNFRIVVAGEHKILLKMKIYDKKDIRGISASSITLHVYPRHGNEIKVLVPLADNDAFKNLKYLNN